jgi:putative membrane-bound dehydrogenase-like protein
VPHVHWGLARLGSVGVIERLLVAGEAIQYGWETMKRSPVIGVRGSLWATEWLRLALMIGGCVAAYGTNASAAEPPPLKVLLVAGGCCHDYEGQYKVLVEGLQARARVKIDVVWTGDKSVNPPLPLYDNPDWAAGYDVVIHDECAAGNNNKETLKRVLAAHQKIPAVHLHCAMHSFRTGEDKWFRHLGLVSTGHGPQEPIEIDFVDDAHPIIAPLKDWITDKEELYNNLEVFDAQPLARGTQKYQRNGQEKVDKAIVVWVNEKQGAKSFSTTLGHNTSTVADPRYLELVARGLLWSCDKLNDAYLQPYKGEPGKVTHVAAAEAPKGQPAGPGQGPTLALPKPPKDATVVKVTASSEETGKNNFAWCALDGDPQTRWCAAGGDYPQWFQWEFDEPRVVDSIRIEWERKQAYQYRVEGSKDGQEWVVLSDNTNNEIDDPRDEKLAAKGPVKFVRIQGLGAKSHGGWCSIWEVKVQGPGIKRLWPKLDAKAQAALDEVRKRANDPFAEKGNTVPEYVQTSPEREAEILKDVKVAEGFEATLFAAPPLVNYPVFVAAAPDGTLYVSSDGNGSLGRKPERGRVIRLRDTNGDGRADETKVFCTVDAPRGLVWDRDRLYLMHPPHLSEYVDADGDGVAESSRVLVKNLAFTYKDRPADHTTNGLSMGIDGRLYIAGGDFGFLLAEGTDGRKLVHRGGGVIAVNPDGTGLEIYSTGTRNILEVAISPALEMFARDNTNDGGGWNVRFHHFVNGDDHGYPRLYKNFADESIAPLADYGGGSGCGATYVFEPGFGRWNDAALTADWGTGGLFRHSVKPKGATFEETAAPEVLVRMTRPTDADVDAHSRLYVASWKGATFDWAGPDVGYIVRVVPQGFRSEPLPDVQRLEDAQLVKLTASPSLRRRLAASRELQHRKSPQYATVLGAATSARSPERALAAALTSTASDQAVVAAVDHADPVVAHVAIREAGKRRLASLCLARLDDSASPSRGVLRALALMHSPDVVTALATRLQQTTEPTRRQALLSALCRLHFREGEWKGDSWGTRPDTRGPYYQPEPWSGTEQVAGALKTALDQASGPEAIFLSQEMARNRIPADDALSRAVALAAKDDTIIADVVARLQATETVPESALPLLQKVAEKPGIDVDTRSRAVICLSRLNGPLALRGLLSGLEILSRESSNTGRAAFDAAVAAYLTSAKLESGIDLLVELAAGDSRGGQLAEAGLLALATRPEAGPEPRFRATAEIDSAWSRPARKRRLLETIRLVRHKPSTARVLAAFDDPDPAIRELAAVTAQVLGVEKVEDRTPKIASLKPDEALATILQTKGNAAWGEYLFTKANCIACHTTTTGLPQRGPYLGNIAKTYKRPELARSILDPDATIAQGFASVVIALDDGRTQSGFVTLESADEVRLRDNTGKEHIFPKSTIEAREKLPTSMMPKGLVDTLTVRELACLLDYLEELAKRP